MKKTLVILMAILLTLSFAACGGSADAEDPIDAAAKTYNLDLKSAEQQEMSSEFATRETLGKVIHDYLKDTTFFSGSDLENTTYADLKEQIGVDASLFYCDSGYIDTLNFIWQAGDNTTAKFMASFREGKLYAVGSTNLG